MYASVGLALGGNGGAGNYGGAVTVDSTTNITTNGMFSPAISGRSVGGGGGEGGFAVSAVLSTGVGIGVSLSGSGAAGGNGGDVTVTSVGNLTTGDSTQGSQKGAWSPGILAELIGGKGGDSGWAISTALGASYGGLSLDFSKNGGNGGDFAVCDSSGHNCRLSVVTVNNNNLATAATNKITTYNDMSAGIFAQSLGGSGGSAGWSVAASGGSYGAISISLGGAGGAGGNAGDVHVTSYGAIETSGRLSDGINAQSNGGGGGDGGFAFAAGGAEYGSVSAALGGGGGNGGQGHTVTVSSTGAITTMGDQSDGIFAQSLGGGGGSGGGAVSGALTFNSSAASLSLGIGGNGAMGGSSGLVQVDSYRDITT